MIVPSLFDAADAERSRGFGVPLPGCVTSEKRLLPVLAVVGAAVVVAGLVVLTAVVDALGVPVAEALLVGADVPAPAAFGGALTVVALLGSDVVSDFVPDAHAARTAALRPAEANPSQNRVARAPAVGAFAAARSDECAAEAEGVNADTSAEAARGEVNE
jgi:hypothetical protein